MDRSQSNCYIERLRNPRILRPLFLSWTQKVCEYDQETLQFQTADQPTARRERNTEHRQSQHN